MIAKMSKVSFIFLEGECNDALEKIRDAGVVHLQEDYRGSSDTLAQLTQLTDRLNRALFALSPKVAIEEESYSREKAVALVDQILDLLDKKKEAEDRQVEIDKQLAFWAPWGDFDPTEVSILHNKGVDLAFYQVPTEDWERFRQEASHAIVVNRTKTNVYALSITMNKESKVDWEPVNLPEFGVSELLNMRRREGETALELEQNLQGLTPRRGLLITLQKELTQDRDFEELRSGLGEDSALLYFSGYIPEEKKAMIKGLASEQGWGFLASEPQEEEAVPTLLKSGKIASLAHPIFNVLDLNPGYREFDISLSFFLFFGAFFAMIIADAGYGAVILGLTLFAQLRARKAHTGFALLYILSLLAIIWGSLSGSWFGSKTIVSIPFLKQMVLPDLAVFPEVVNSQADSTATVMFICFLLAVVQLSLGRVKSFIRALPSLKAISELGWLAIIVAAYFLVNSLVLGLETIPFAIVQQIALGGLILVILFGSQGPGIPFLRGLGKGLGGGALTVLDVIGVFSQVISYIRLFAVGMASFAIASSFNTMAESMMKGPFWIAAAVVLLIGHSLNLVMGGLSLLVHGVRLNLLEYSNHLNMEWSGFRYKPFKRVIEE